MLILGCHKCQFEGALEILDISPIRGEGIPAVFIDGEFRLPVCTKITVKCTECNETYSLYQVLYG